MLIWTFSQAMITKPWPMCPIIQPNWTSLTLLFLSGRNDGDPLITRGVADRFTHLIEHPVSETQQLPKQVQPAVEERKESQQKYHYTCWGNRERHRRRRVRCIESEKDITREGDRGERVRRRGRCIESERDITREGEQEGEREKSEMHWERERQSETQKGKVAENSLEIAMVKLIPPHLIDSNDRLQCISHAWEVKVYGTATGRLMQSTWEWWIEQG